MKDEEFNDLIKSIEQAATWAQGEHVEGLRVDGNPMSFREFAADLARRREALGEINMPRNSGKRRTESKKALLKAIRDVGGKW